MSSHKPQLRAVPIAQVQASASGAQYVYDQSSPSMIESVLSTILHPGVNAATFRVLNWTLVSLAVVIGLMLWAFDWIDARFRIHFWAFLAVTVGLAASVNWFIARMGDDEEEEEEEEEKEAEAEAEGESAEEEAEEKKASEAAKEEAESAKQRDSKSRKEDVKSNVAADSSSSSSSSNKTTTKRATRSRRAD